MRVPSFQRLAEEIEAEGFLIASYASRIHPNPRFYKYYWWVFWQQSPCDGHEFLSTCHRLPTKQAFDLMQTLQSKRLSYWLYNQQLPRLDPLVPFDPSAQKWQGIEWAPTYNDDIDPEYRGYK